ncbi:MAG: TIGR01777 family oxidoreductase [Acidiferrobacterales bacterium]|nr:TIGR01777 family oxidoreductase [Acidiferrobacterales bacterium]
MNVLVTGGTGFIGRALCATLLARGDQVLVLTRDRQRAQRILDTRVTAIESLEEIDAASVPATVVNLAGLSLGSARWNEALKRQFVTSRVGTTAGVIDYIATTTLKPQALISGSAVGYYGARGDEELTEESTAGDEYQSELCRAWEAEALKGQAHGVRVCLLRSGVVLGKGGGALSSLIPQFKLGLGGYVGTGQQWMSWIHMEDLLAIIQRLITDTSLKGAFNSTAPHPETNRDFAAKLAAALHRPAMMWAPAPVLRLVVGEMAHLYLTGQRVIPKRLLEAGYQFRYPELSGALANILG